MRKDETCTDEIRHIEEELRLNSAGKLARMFLTSPLTTLIALVMILMGIMAVFLTPREENPQIDVPSAMVMVMYPGANSDEVQRIIVDPLARKLNEMTGVDMVYGMAMNSVGIVNVAFEVGEPKEISFLKLYDRVMQNMDLMPKEVMQPLIKPIDIDEVPIVTLAISSDKYRGADLYRIAQRVVNPLAEVADVSVVGIKGGHKRQFNVLIDPEKLSAYNLFLGQVAKALGENSAAYPLGVFESGSAAIPVEFPAFINSKKDVENIIVAVYQNRPIYLRDVATITDGVNIQDKHETTITLGKAYDEKLSIDQGTKADQVTVFISKKRGTNAVFVASDVMDKVELIKRELPQGVELIVTRDDGKKANESVNELIFHIFISIAIIVALLMVMLGWRESLIVAFTVPLILAVTLFIGMLADQTINRITLFALILSLGLLVDSAIVVIENIHRHFSLGKVARDKAAIFATNEIGNPTNVATLAVILAFVPMLFVTGMMGPYMAPIPFNVPIAMLASLVIAYIFTPYLAVRFLPDHADHEPFDIKKSKIYQLYNRFVRPMLEVRAKRYAFMGVLILLFVGSLAMPMFQLVLFKMLPGSNTNTFNVTIDLPAGSSMHKTREVSVCIENLLIRENEVRDFETFIGTGGVIDFNGLLRGGGMKRGENIAEIRVNLMDKHARSEQSGEIASRMRPAMQACGLDAHANIKLVEDPPGPPVVATIVAEVYGSDRAKQEELAEKIERLFKETKGLVDIDIMREKPTIKYQIIPDKEKAMLAGITTDQIAQVLALGLYGNVVSLVRLPHEKEQVGIFVRYEDKYRSSPNDIERIRLMNPQTGRLVPLGELATVIPAEKDRLITSKNLKELSMVTAEMDKRGSIYALFDIWGAIKDGKLGNYDVEMSDGLRQTMYLTDRATKDRFTIHWTGEWEITFDVFRDLGTAFGVAVVLIYLLMVAYYGSFRIPGIVLSAVPLTFIGVLPGHFIMNLFMPTYFTATSMIGFIALAGIVVRNSLLLVDFTYELISQGMELNDAIIEAAATRFRPIVLTALAIILASVVIVADPVWQGLAVALIFGVLASTVLTLVVIPLLYWRYMRKRGGLKEAFDQVGMRRV